MKICQNCKVEYDDVETFCIRCGKKLAAEGFTLDSMNERLKRMEENLTRLGRAPAAAPEAQPISVERPLQELKQGLMEKINHNADAIERLAERLKELDGMTAGDRERARAAVRGMIADEAKNAANAAAPDLRKELQNISSKLAVLSEEVGKLERDVSDVRRSAAEMESRVAKSIYKELTKSLIT